MEHVEAKNLSQSTWSPMEEGTTHVTHQLLKKSVVVNPLLPCLQEGNQNLFYANQ